jgi:hypothetical protein
MIGLGAACPARAAISVDFYEGVRNEPVEASWDAMAAASPLSRLRIRWTARPFSAESLTRYGPEGGPS